MRTIRPSLISGLMLGLGLAACAPAPESAPAEVTAATVTTPATSTTPGDEPAAPALAPPPADFRLLEVMLGNAVDGEGRVRAAVERFRPGDSFQLSVLASATSQPLELGARWSTAAGELLAEDRQPLPAGPASLSRFHLKHPQGWPAGAYRVELAINGLAVDHRDFEVVAP